MSKKLLSEFLEGVAHTPISKKTIRDDQACLLVLTCATFRDIPPNLKKYLFYAQEVIFHARWMTKANGYLRILLFSRFTLDLDQLKTLQSICKFIIDVYTPMFTSIFTHPSVVDGPKLTLLNRDLLLASEPEIAEPAWPSFLRHGSLWVSPKNVALASLSDEPPVLPSNVRKMLHCPSILNRLRTCCWGKRSYLVSMTLRHNARLA